jgi:hypothetical protein
MSSSLVALSDLLERHMKYLMEFRQVLDPTIDLS